MAEKGMIELLAPAGDEECFKAAIAAGADAVYFGMEQFSARTRAKNITVEQTGYLIPLAHKNNCRAYLTLNTLITDSEIPDAISLVQKAVNCGIDAVIVQDLGILKLLRTCFPDLELHASTQMTTHNLSQCEYLSGLGVSQVNLSRELSLSEIREITEFLHSKNIVPEIFVQGAFCISYSGQCYLSGHLYGEAGNRGSCVQPCRRNWCTSDDYDIKSSKALFHLKDNSAFSLADKLINQNIPVSLKIEGRIKNAEYVWAVTSAWREQINRILSQKEILKSSNKLTGVINRDYTCGYLEGKISNQMFSNGEKDISQIKAGTVKTYIADSKTLILCDDARQSNLKVGDRLTIKTSGEQFICTAKVTGKNSKGYLIQITNKLTKKILGGQIVYKSSSAISPEELQEILEKVSPKNINPSYCNTNQKFKTDIFVKAKENEKLEITFESQNQKISVHSDQLLAKAQKTGLTEETLKEKLSKLGETNFILNNFSVVELDPSLFISLSELNNLRRKAINLLEEKIHKAAEEEKPDTVSHENIKLQTLQDFSSPVSRAQNAYLIDSEKSLEQLILEKTLNKKDFKIIYELPPLIHTLNNKLFTLLNENPDIVLYFNSILLNPDLTDSLDFLQKLDNFSSRTILCENTGLAYELKKLGCKIILGSNCNIYNSWNILEHYETLQPQGIIPSLELSPENTEKLYFPENLQIWYPKEIFKLLMQSRQCLLRNGSGCTKSHVDRTCIETCTKRLELTGTQGEKILAIKRKGFYSALYTAELQRNMFSRDFTNKVSVWIIDKRDFKEGPGLSLPVGK